MTTKIKFRRAPVTIRWMAMLVLLSTGNCRKQDDDLVFTKPDSQIKIYQTKDLDLEDLAKKYIVESLRAKIEDGRLPPDTDCAFALLDAQTGDELVHIGTIQQGTEFDNAKYLTRSCGSIAKLVVYAAALQARVIEPDAELMDEPRIFPCPECSGGVWSPQNYGDRYANEPIPLIEAFAWSKNVPAVDVYQRLRREDFVATLDGLGLPPPKNFTTAPLGVEWTPVQLASAFTAFVNNGAKVNPRSVSHQIIEEQRRETPVVKGPAVFRDDVCEWIIRAGRLCLREGTGRIAADLSDVLAGKTGSSDSALVAMFGPRVSAVIWIGNRQTNEDLGMTGGRLALPLMADFFRAVRLTRPDLLPKWNNYNGGITTMEDHNVREID